MGENLIVKMGGFLSLARSSIREKFGVDRTLNMLFHRQLDMELSLVLDSHAQGLTRDHDLEGGLEAGRHTCGGDREARHVDIESGSGLGVDLVSNLIMKLSDYLNLSLARISIREDSGHARPSRGVQEVREKYEYQCEIFKHIAGPGRGHVSTIREAANDRLLEERGVGELGLLEGVRTPGAWTPCSSEPPFFASGTSACLGIGTSEMGRFCWARRSTGT